MTSKSKSWSFILILISGAIALLPFITHAVTFQYGKPITIDHTKVPATLTNFPILVSIANDNDLKNHVTSPNGYDLVFTDAVGIPLDHELERWDGGTGTLVAWVRIPTLSSTTDTMINLLYGNSGITTSQENKTGVWDTSFKGVWHLANGVTLNTAASNSGGNSFTISGVTATGGQIDGAASFVRSSSTYLSQPSDSNNNVSGDITLSLWLHPTYALASGEYYTLIHKDNQYSITLFSDGISWADGTNWSYANFGHYNIGTQNNVWQHLVATKTGTTVTIYLNGVQKVQKTFGSSGVTSRTTPLALGTYNLSSGYYGGYEDEVRISNVARSADWALAEYNSQSSPSTFYSVGSEGGGGFINHPPIAQNQNVSTTQDTAKAITLVATDADNDPITYQIVADPTHGTLSGTAPNVTYTPTPGYSGSDSFTFKANDGTVDSNVATVSVTVNPLINCGQTLAGTISAAAEKDPYTFTASANDAITIRARKTSGALTPYIELYSPGGALITGAANQVDRILTETGTYRIDIRDQNNTNTGDYLLFWQRMSNPCNATPIDCGQVVTGSIGVSVDPPPWRVYTFTGAVNDVVTIRTGNLTGGNFLPNIELYSPTGSLLVSNYTQVDRTLTAAGTYTILMRSYSAGYAGNFALTWQKMNAPCNATPINCGQTLAGSISAAGELDLYTFTASANDVVTIRGLKTSGTLNLYFELFNATGSRIAGPSNQINMTLSTAGTYTIMARDYNTTATGNYLIYWQRPSSPCNVVANLDCGQVVSGSVGVSVDPPPWRVYTFTGAVNDVVTIRAASLTANFTPNIELYSPTGGLLVSNYNQVDRTLTAAGTYTILMRSYSGNAGNFALTWQKMNAPCNPTPINCGQTLAGLVSAAGELDLYTFTASANDVVTIRGLKTSGTLNLYFELFNATGSRIAGPSNQINMTLSTAGTYTIMARDYNTTATGNYLITWQKFNAPCAPVINCGQAAAGAIGFTAEAPPWGFYSFTVSANDVITIRAIKTSGTLVPYLELYNSSGGLVTSAAGQINRTMAAGSYILLLRDQSNVNTGNYAVTWQRWNNPCAQAASCSQVMTGSIGITADPPPWRYYSLTASANDSVTVRASKTSGTLTPYLEIYNSSGTQIASGAGQKDMTLTAAGTYTAMVRDQSSINTGDYVFTWLRAANPCNAIPVGCGQLLSGSLSAAGKIDAYTILGNAGDNIAVTLTKTSGGLDPSLELYNSSGARVAYQYTPSGNETVMTQTLSAGGTYTVFASDYGNDETGAYTLRFQKNNNSCTEISLLGPNGGEGIPSRSTVAIQWSCTSPSGVTSQEIRLSTDGGASFPTLIATGLAGDVRTYNWVVPPDLTTTQGRIRVTATDGLSMNPFDDSDSDFTVYPGGRIYLYDELNRLIQVIFEDGRRVTYTYDASGNRITVTNE